MRTVVGVVAALWAGWSGAITPVQAREMFFVFKMSRLARAHPASCSVGNQGIYPQGVMWSGHVADHSLPSSVEDRSEGA